MEHSEQEKILFTLRKTRKAFIIEYVCGALILALLLIAKMKGLSLPVKAQQFMLAIALFSIATAELSRLYVRYFVSTSKILVIKGFLKQTKKNIYFHSLAFVPEINISQTPLQRLLNYGKIYGHSNNVDSLNISDIHNPKQVLEKIETLIERNKSH